MKGDDVDPDLALTVAAVWRQERISCPHPNVLQSHLQGSLPAGAAEFVAFHLRDSSCPYCNAVVDDLRAQDAGARTPQLEDLRDRLLRSTAAALRQTRA
ncbi:MAG: hypothetical protein JNL08_03160 [Planctomycetes bacterium]|nr:hypothetical protein [Planctomycetota bacterium]